MRFFPYYITSHALLQVKEVNFLTHKKYERKIVLTALSASPFMSAEIPPAGAPSGFDSAAFFDFIA